MMKTIDFVDTPKANDRKNREPPMNEMLQSRIGDDESDSKLCLLILKPIVYLFGMLSKQIRNASQRRNTAR